MKNVSRINREEQIKVVIRLKPDQNETKFTKAVYISDTDEN
jgi:hypothetical protein